MKREYVLFLTLLVLLLAILFTIAYQFMSFKYDFNNFRKELKNMKDKSETKVSKLNYYCDKCFCLLASMKLSENESDFKERKKQFDYYFEKYLKEKQMLIDFDKLLGD